MLEIENMCYNSRNQPLLLVILEKVSHVENNIFDHNVATNCNIDTKLKKNLLFNCYLISLFTGMNKKKCVCYVWPWIMGQFNEILTNQSRSFLDCILKSSNFSIMHIIHVYECYSRSHFWVKAMSRSNKSSKICILLYTIYMPNMEKKVIEISQKMTKFQRCATGW